jgi:ABC-type sugar transport system ATPase subunit
MIRRSYFLIFARHCAEAIFMPYSENHHSFIPSSKLQEESSPILEIKALSKQFSDKKDSRGLENLNFTIDPGQITAIIGESGSGKSTLLRLIYGLIKVDEGEIFFRGQRVKGPHEQLIPGHESMRMVSQHFDDLNTYANVWDNVASRLSNTDLTDKENKTSQILERLKISKLKHQRIADLSGGEKQRVAIARALVTEPKVLLMDEPFNQIDSAFRDQLQSDIRHIVNETGLTVILVSHDPGEVMGLADYLVILHDGSIIAKGSPTELYQNPPNAYVARTLTKSNVLSAEQAGLLGIEKQQVAIHPEWIELHADSLGSFQIDRVIYRGFYEEIIIKSGELDLRVYQMATGKWQAGQSLSLRITRFVYL